MPIFSRSFATKPFVKKKVKFEVPRGTSRKANVSANQLILWNQPKGYSSRILDMQLTQKERIYLDLTSRYIFHEERNKPMGAIQTP